MHMYTHMHTHLHFIYYFVLAVLMEISDKLGTCYVGMLNCDYIT